MKLWKRAPMQGRRQRGQGMTEYIIIVALIAILCIGAVTIFGHNIRALFGSSANAIAGKNEHLETGTVTDSTKTLENFDDKDEAP